MRDNDHGNHHRGLVNDLRKISEDLSRRQMLGLLGTATLVPLVGCAKKGANANGGSVSKCSTIPSETAGPFPGDGTNGANALALAGIVRSDIRASIAGVTGTADGIPLTVKLTLVNTGASCTPRADYAVYVWHCDRDGAYSLYSGSAQAQNYLRGVQQSDADGNLTFTTIFPACYSGRWPHIHFEIYSSIAAATNGANAVHTSQLAMPEAPCNEVFASAGYEASVSNLAQVSLASDNVFGDGATQQLASVTGNVKDGYVGTLVVGVEA